MSNARTLASYASNFPSFRNRIINGNLSNPINQRGAALTASSGYTYDRWYYDGSTYLYQGIEDKNVNNGTYVISWAGAGINAAWKVSTDTTAGNGPDATTGFTSVSNGGTFTVNEGTEYSKHLWIRFDGTLANLDKVMVEEGTVATPFEHRPYELALCQRYYFKTFNQSVVPAQAADSYGALWGSSSATNISFISTMKLPVSMRTTPNPITLYSTTNSNSNWSDQSGNQPTSAVLGAGENAISVRATGSIAAGGAHSIHITAEAEL